MQQCEPIYLTPGEKIAAAQRLQLMLALSHVTKIQAYPRPLYKIQLRDEKDRELTGNQP